MVYLLGIDNGNTVSKAALFDELGREVAVASAGAETFYPRPGWTERSMESLWTSTAQAIRAVIEKAGVKPQDIIGIGNTGHGNGLYLLDKHGQPVRNGIQSLDTRADRVLQDRAKRGVLEKAFPMILQEFWPAQPNALLPWLKYHEPDCYARISKIVMCKDYVKFRLTGEVTTDYTDISGTCLLDNANKRYSRDLLEWYDIPETWDALPRLAESTEVIGRVTKEAAEATGLAEGTPVVAGLFDVDAGALGSGVIAPRTLCIIAGTWSINELLIDYPAVNPALAMVHVGMVPGRWMVLEGSATSMANLEWFVNTLCGEEKQAAQQRGVSVYEICSELVGGLPPGSTDIIFHPFLFGSNVQATARAGFYGVAGWHTKAHLLRALYEGVVYGHMNHIDKLRALGPLSVARLTGGGSRSAVWTQIFADALNMTMEVPDGGEVSALGAAMSAGIGVGVYRDHADAVQQAVRVARRQEPIVENTPHYQARYQAYKQLLDVMRQPWETLHGLGR